MTVFIIVILFIIISGEVLYIFQNSALIELLIIIVIIKSTFMIFLVLFIIYKLKIVNKTILNISLILGMIIFLIIISEELQTIFGFSQNDLLPNLPSNMILLPQWISDIVIITIQTILSNIIILKINFLLLIAGFSSFYFLFIFLVKKYYTINDSFVESSLEGLFLIIIILEIFLSILDHNSHLFTSSIIICTILAFLLLINKRNLLKFEEMNKRYRMIIYWIFLRAL